MLKTMKIAACIILYHPDLEDLTRNILAIKDNIDHLILWKNSSEDISDLKVLSSLSCGLDIMGDGTNQYISTPLNSCLEWCKFNGYDYLLTMDQDSEFESFGGFIDAIRALPDDVSRDTIIFAPNINNRYSCDQEVLSIESTITSGSLCNVDKSCKIGGFREKYQIYWVDSEFCHRSHLNGYKILCLTRNNLKQQFGKKERRHGVDVYNYSKVTYFFIFRNMLWMHREYKSNPSIKTILYSSQMYLKSIIMGEKDKISKIISVTKGIYQGITRKYK